MALFGLIGKNDNPRRTESISTYSFQAAGINHSCLFPSGRFKGRTRQFVLDKCHVGDAVYLRPYEWEGEPAFAIMSKKYDTDIGVVPADKIQLILKKTSAPGVIAGTIIDIRVINPDEEDYTKIKKIFDVRLNF